MKLEPVTKIDKQTRQRKKSLTTTSCRQIEMLFFQFMADLEQSEAVVCQTYIFINSSFSSYKN